MRFVSFNINGLRAHMHQLDAIIKKFNPDVIGLQETKVHDNDFPTKTTLKYGYNIYFYGQKQYHGVAIFSRQLPSSVIAGLFHDSNLSQKRDITTKIVTPIGILTIINVYFPHGNNNRCNKFIFKKQFYQNFQKHIEHTYNDQSLLLIMGDMNISPTDLDIGIGEKNQKKWLASGRCSFLPEERQWIRQLMNWGLIDIYREQYPYESRYSWFSYTSDSFSKNRGLRIDLILVTKPLMQRVQCINIDYSIRNMQHPSDHAPIWVDFDI